MIPVHFGHSDRKLFGVYTPASGKRLRRGAVLCNPWCGEAMRAHRSIKMLADTLSRAGIDTLRFDYYGTGDSFGDGSAASLTDWCGDAELAADELLGMANINRTALIGLRLGAYVAAAAAARMPRKIDRLVLWDPAFDGASHLEELTGRRDPQPRNVEVSGYPLSTELQAELAGAKLPDLRPGPLPVLIAWSNAPNENASFELGGCPITTEARDAAPCWVEEKDFGAGAVPIEIIQAIASWLQQK